MLEQGIDLESRMPTPPVPPRLDLGGARESDFDQVLTPYFEEWGEDYTLYQIEKRQGLILIAALFAKADGRLIVLIILNPKTGQMVVVDEQEFPASEFPSGPRGPRAPYPTPMPGERVIRGRYA
jgi:hypothetical protein